MINKVLTGSDLVHHGTAPARTSLAWACTGRHSRCDHACVEDRRKEPHQTHADGNWLVVAGLCCCMLLWMGLTNLILAAGATT